MTSTMKIEDGNKVWRNEEGELHRLDGPAVERADGTKAWWVDDKRHRLDGPAVERADGTKAWWVDDEELTEAEFKKRKRVGRPKGAATKVIRIPVSKIKVVEKITGKGFAKKQVAHVMVRVPARLVAKIRKAITLLALCLLPMTASAESLQTEISATVANGAYIEAGEVVGSHPVMVIREDGSTEYVF